jgi:alcohol dehydrogenase (cytochrome c)
MRTLFVSSVLAGAMAGAIWGQDAVIPRNQAQPEVDRTFTTTDGQTVSGRVMNEGSIDIQLREASGRIRLLRKADNGRVRVVTSQTDWPTYNGDNGGNRYSTLTQINKNNASKLALQWMFPLGNVNQVENTPLVVDGVMYISSANQVWALDAGTGRQIWTYRRPRTQGITDNAHLLALSKANGELLWETTMADSKENYNGTSAPLIAGGLVISGTAGGDEGVRGFVAAYDPQTGKEVWRFWTVPRPGQPGAEEVEHTWQGANADHRSGATWMTGTYDDSTGLVYWPVGNPGPDFDGSDRLGDNLYTDCVIALDAKTGQLKWYYQFTPHDVHDWDAQETPVLIDANWQGQPRKLMIQANRNGFFYVLDRTDGKLLLAKPFLNNLNWASGIGADGKPVLKELPKTADGNNYVCPGFQGGTNWFSTSYNPATGLYYFNALERCNVFSVTKGDWQAGRGFMGGAARPAPGETFEKFLRGVDIQTGEVKINVPQVSRETTASGGVISTASGLVFYAENSGALIAADASTGKTLWQFQTNQVWKASPMMYQFDGKQHIAIAAGNSILSFALQE